MARLMRPDQDDVPEIRCGRYSGAAAQSPHCRLVNRLEMALNHDEASISIKAPILVLHPCVCA